MAKHKKRKLAQQKRSKPHSRPGPHLPKSANTSSSKLSSTPTAKPHHQPSQTIPTIPFTVYDRILLIGEGDFSFAHSIVKHHGCADVTATSYDPLSTALEKYPQAEEYIEYLEEEDQRVIHDVDATKLASYKALRIPDGEGKTSYDVIMFNFPHVGGLSTDVNRQVRANQSLLVKFLEEAKKLLAEEGTIVVTLFEGEPYTLWNVRDLARHVGLGVRESFRFQAGAYEGYHHARTLGNIKSKAEKKGGEEVKVEVGDKEQEREREQLKEEVQVEGDDEDYGVDEQGRKQKRPGAWRGEERPARSYVFELKKEDQAKKSPGGKRKRKGDASDSDDD